MAAITPALFFAKGASMSIGFSSRLSGRKLEFWSDLQDVVGPAFVLPADRPLGQADAAEITKSLAACWDRDLLYAAGRPRTLIVTMASLSAALDTANALATAPDFRGRQFAADDAQVISLDRIPPDELGRMRGYASGWAAAKGIAGSSTRPPST